MPYQMYEWHATLRKKNANPLPGAANAGLAPSGFGWKYLHESPYLQVPCSIKGLASKFRVAYSWRM